MQIEQDAFPDPWSEGDFIRALRQPEVIGMVAEEADVVTGYVIYELHKKKLI
jgi:ribosomal protein S18 acetylase RimI-like enzyme